MTQFPNAFVIGHPIAHSRSPLLHGYWLKTLGIAGSYTAIDVAPADLPDFVARLRAGAFVGGNVTIPHKQTVMALCDRLDPVAQSIGAVNTLVIENGQLEGRNTDAEGFLKNLDAGAPGWDSQPGPALVLGAGGAARAVIAGLLQRGLGPIRILNRTPDRAGALANAFGNAPAGLSGHPLGEFAALAPKAKLLVNTSSVGMHGTTFSGLDLAGLPASCLVTDLVYTPLETPLLAAARARGLKTVDGLGMLLFQAVSGFAAWFGAVPEVTEEVRALILRDLEAE